MPKKSASQRSGNRTVSRRTRDESGSQQTMDMGDGVVNLRKWDNILQGIVALIVALPGMTFGYLIGGGHGALIGGLAGFVVGGLMAGLVLMYVGWVRRWNSRTPRTKS